MPIGGMVISFDLELGWASRTSVREAPDIQGVERTREVVEQLLEIFARYEISATWAMVGHLMLRAEDCPGGRHSYPLIEPAYRWFDGRWYDGIPGFGAPGYERYYAPDIVERITGCAAPQELASHTFSHIIVQDPDCSAEVLRAELAAAQDLARRWGLPFTSMIFPRNLVGHLDEVRTAGFRCFRATNSEWYWFGHAATINARRRRRALVAPLRLLDEWMCLPPPLPPVRRVSDLWEIPHSMFFPGFSGVGRLVSPGHRLRRASHGMHRALRQGRLFSLTAHPQDFLGDGQALLATFEAICQEAAQLRDQGDFEILTMRQIADVLDQGRCRHWMTEGRATPVPSEVT
ncbi:MAG: hypothetical protein WDZ59_04025 [Pirellulales bacterium]